MSLKIIKILIIQTKFKMRTQLIKINKYKKNNNKKFKINKKLNKIIKNKNK